MGGSEKPLVLKLVKTLALILALVSLVSSLSFTRKKTCYKVIEERLNLKIYYFLHVILLGLCLQMFKTKEIECIFCLCTYIVFFYVKQQ